MSKVIIILALLQVVHSLEMVNDACGDITTYSVVEFCPSSVHLIAASHHCLGHRECTFHPPTPQCDPSEATLEIAKACGMSSLEPAMFYAWEENITMSCPRCEPDDFDPECGADHISTDCGHSFSHRSLGELVPYEAPNGQYDIMSDTLMEPVRDGLQIYLGSFAEMDGTRTSETLQKCLLGCHDTLFQWTNGICICGGAQALKAGSIRTWTLIRNSVGWNGERHTYVGLDSHREIHFSDHTTGARVPKGCHLEFDCDELDAQRCASDDITQTWFDTIGGSEDCTCKGWCRFETVNPRLGGTYRREILSTDTEEDANCRVTKRPTDSYDINLIVYCKSDATVVVRSGSAILFSGDTVSGTASYRLAPAETSRDVSVLAESGGKILTIDQFQQNPPYEDLNTHCPAHCYGCLESWENISCRSRYDNGMALALLILICSLIALSGGWILWMIVGFIWGSCKVYSCCVCVSRAGYRSGARVKNSFKNFYKKVSSDEPNSNPAEGGLSDHNRSDVDLEQPRHRPYRSWSERNKRIAGMSVLGMVSGASSCSIGVTTTSSTPACTHSGTTETCYQSFQTQMEIAGTGDSACESFNNTDGRPMGMIEFTFESVTFEVSLERNYYTSAWTPQVSQSDQCWTPWNTCGGRCDGIHDDDLGYSGNWLSGPAASLPGSTSCFRNDGCAANGCFYCDPKCDLARAGLKPVGDVVEVFSVTTLNPVPVISISIGGVKEYATVRSSSASFIDGQIQVRVMSFRAPALPVLNPRKIVKFRNGSAFSALAANPDENTWGVIGDIQSKTMEGLLNPNLTSFRHPAQFSWKPKSMTWIPPPSGLSSSKLEALPNLVNGYLWKWERGRLLVVNASSPWSMEISVTGQGVPTHRDIQPVVPEGRVIGSSGCYECAKDQSHVMVELWSSTYSGVVNINSKDGLLQPIPVLSITTEPANYSIPVETDSREGDAVFEVKGMSGTLTLSFHYRFTSGTDVVDNGNSTIPRVHRDDDTLSGDPFKFMFGSIERGIATFLTISIFFASLYYSVVICRMCPKMKKS